MKTKMKIKKKRGKQRRLSSENKTNMPESHQKATHTSPLEFQLDKDASVSVSRKLSLSNVIDAQQFNGSWTIETLAKLIPTTSDSLRNELPSTLADKFKTLENAFITAIIVAYLGIVFTSQKTLWELVLKKS